MDDKYDVNKLRNYEKEPISALSCCKCWKSFQSRTYVEEFRFAPTGCHRVQNALALAISWLSPSRQF